MSLADFKNDIRNIKREFNKLGIKVINFYFIPKSREIRVYSADFKISYYKKPLCYIRLDMSECASFKSTLQYIESIVNTHRYFRSEVIENDFIISNAWDDSIPWWDIDRLNNEFKDLLYDIIKNLKNDSIIEYSFKTIHVVLKKRELPTDTHECHVCGSILHPKLVDYTYYKPIKDTEGANNTITIHNVIGYVCDNDNIKVFPKNEVVIIEDIINNELKPKKE